MRTGVRGGKRTGDERRKESERRARGERRRQEEKENSPKVKSVLGRSYTENTVQEINKKK